MLGLCATLLTAPAFAQPSGSSAAKPPPGSVAAGDAGFQAPEAKRLYAALVSGRFSLDQALAALKLREPQALVNVIHALGADATRRDMHELLLDLWAGAEGRRPGLAWDLLREPPARVAVAAVLVRADSQQAPEYAAYARAHLQGEQTVLSVAQAVVALAWHGRAEDVPLLAHVAAGEHPYVVQSALSALALMNKPEARDALIELERQFAKEARAPLIRSLLRSVYDWPPRQRLAPLEPAPAKP